MNTSTLPITLAAGNESLTVCLVEQLQSAAGSSRAVFSITNGTRPIPAKPDLIQGLVQGDDILALARIGHGDRLPKSGRTTLWYQYSIALSTVGYTITYTTDLPTSGGDNSTLQILGYRSCVVEIPEQAPCTPVSETTPVVKPLKIGTLNGTDIWIHPFQESQIADPNERRFFHCTVGTKFGAPVPCSTCSSQELQSLIARNENKILGHLFGDCIPENPLICVFGRVSFYGTKSTRYNEIAFVAGPSEMITLYNRAQVLNPKKDDHESTVAT